MRTQVELSFNRFICWMVFVDFLIEVCTWRMKALSNLHKLQRKYAICSCILCLLNAAVVLFVGTKNCITFFFALLVTFYLMDHYIFNKQNFLAYQGKLYIYIYMLKAKLLSTLFILYNFTIYYVMLHSQDYMVKFG